MFITPKITIGLIICLQEALCLPVTKSSSSRNDLLRSEEHGSLLRLPDRPSYRERKSSYHPLPQFLLPHHQLHVIPLRQPAIHQNNNILVLTPSNVTTQLVPILVPFQRNHYVPAQAFVPMHHNGQNVYLHDVSVIPLHQSVYEQKLERVRAKEMENEEAVNQYRMYYGGFGNGLYFGGHGAGHGFYAYG